MDMRAYAKRLETLDKVVTTALNQALTPEVAPAVPMTIYCLAQIALGFVLRKASSMDRIPSIDGRSTDRDALCRVVIRTLLTQEKISPELRAKLEPISQEPGPPVS